LDSLCYHITLSYQWWKASGRTAIFTPEWIRCIWIILNLWTVEQRHEEKSPYRYIELVRDGKGSYTQYTGMTWSAFRPSDDQTKFGYLIPSNMHAVVALRNIAEIAREVLGSDVLEKAALKLAQEIDDGIHNYAVIDSKVGKVYAYEVDGNNNYNLMDDANVPSLLSISYLGYTSPHDPEGKIIQNTRKFVLSSENPYYHVGSAAKGIGSVHTAAGSIWHMSIIMQGLTTDDPVELEEVVKMLQDTDAGTGFMHESFMPSNPRMFTRHWFSWANSLFSELILKNLNYLANNPPPPTSS